MPVWTHTARWLWAVGRWGQLGVSLGPAEPVPAQILYARDVDQRSTTFEKSLLMGKEFQRRAKAMMLRAAVLRNQIHVKVGWREVGGLARGGAGARRVGPGGCELLLVSPAVPAQRREPGGADSSQQPVPDEHQHVRDEPWPPGHLHPLPTSTDLLTSRRLSAACGPAKGPGHWVPPSLCALAGAEEAGGC